MLDAALPVVLAPEHAAEQLVLDPQRVVLHLDLSVAVELAIVGVAQAVECGLAVGQVPEKPHAVVGCRLNP